MSIGTAPPAGDSVTLDGSSLSVGSVARAARGGARVSLSDGAWARIEAGRAVVDEAVANGTPLYGVTNGLGNRADEVLPADALSDFSLMTVRGRAVGSGPPLPAEIVRAAMLIRLNTICLGCSGASRDVASSLMAAFNAGLVPEMPETGSIGSSDLCVMAHLGLALIGEGAFVDSDGACRPAAEVLARHGLPVLRPGPKDGLVLCSNSAHTAARAALALHDAARLLETVQTTAALAMEGFRANLTPLDPRAAAARPQPGQARAAAGLRQRLAGSRLFRQGGPRRLQDPFSLRCVAAVHGAAYTALDFAGSALDPEVNGCGDNPLVLPADGTAISTGNFQLPLLTVALDAAGQALVHVAVSVAGRCARLLSGGQAGLPEFLSAQYPQGSGFAPSMKTVEALLAHIRHEAAATTPAISASPEGVEDTIANAPLAAMKLQRLIEHFDALVAVEALISARAVELAGVRGELPVPVARAYESIRERSGPLEQDRPLSPDLRRVTDLLVRSGALAGEASAADGISVYR